MPTISSALEALILQVLGQSVTVSSGDLVRGVSELSKWFTTDRSARPALYLDRPHLSAAYLAYFLPVNLSKVEVLLDELAGDQGEIGEAAEAISVLDVGSGPGTAALGVLDWMVQHGRQDRTLRVTAVDRSKAALQSAMRLWDGYCREAQVSSATLHPCEGNIEKTHSSQHWKAVQDAAPYDVIIMANSLNELFVESNDSLTKRAAVVAELLGLLKPHGTLMILEPALRDITRELHQVRDLLLADKRCTIYSPCLHEQACPALIRRDDWCHEERPWEPPAMIQTIDREVGFIKDALKFSYLLLRKDGRTIVQRQPDVYRMVSELRVMKGEKRAWLCNELGRTEVGRLDRLRQESNQEFDRCHRGAVVRIDPIVKKTEAGAGLGRIPKDGTVRIVKGIAGG